ncbi:cupin domain-containing protein [Halorarius halobius]|uniref:cupin domain-containing protein n=1 Tax=Halorarius halobius TaxID=2962671 RepID=UPI0020CBF7F3|nr:cupin domain-containing protein [Halorarius halobius]
MSEQTGGVDADPLVVTGGTDEAGEEFVRFEVTVHPRPGAGDGGLAHERHLFDNSDPHVHPKQEERFEVVAGEYGIERDGTEHRLTPGDELTVPAGTPHRQFNPTAEPIRVVHEHRPPRESAEIFESFYALAQAGETDEKGMPGLLRTAVLVDEYPGHTYRPTPPVVVQKAMFGALAAVGRLAGYEATHAHEDVTDRT